MTSSAELDAWVIRRPWLSLYGNWIRRGNNNADEVLHMSRARAVTL